MDSLTSRRSFLSGGLVLLTGSGLALLSGCAGPNLFNPKSPRSLSLNPSVDFLDTPQLQELMQKTGVLSVRRHRSIVVRSDIKGDISLDPRLRRKGSLVVPPQTNKQRPFGEVISNDPGDPGNGGGGGGGGSDCQDQSITDCEIQDASDLPIIACVRSISNTPITNMGASDVGSSWDIGSSYFGGGGLPDVPAPVYGPIYQIPPQHSAICDIPSDVFAALLGVANTVLSNLAKFAGPAGALGRAAGGLIDGVIGADVFIDVLLAALLVPDVLALLVVAGLTVAALFLISWACNSGIL